MVVGIWGRGHYSFKKFWALPRAEHRVAARMRPQEGRQSAPTWPQYCVKVSSRGAWRSEDLIFPMRGVSRMLASGA
eukprot:5492658-Pyramimonas_sp.AAC.1